MPVAISFPGHFPDPIQAGEAVATICERQEEAGRAEGPSRDGVCLTTVSLATSEAKREESAVKGL